MRFIISEWVNSFSEQMYFTLTKHTSTVSKSMHDGFKIDTKDTHADC